MYFHNMGFTIDNDVDIAKLKTGEEVSFKPNLSDKKIDVYYKDSKIGNLLNLDNSTIFEVPDIFCERIYNARDNTAIGEFIMNFLHDLTGSILNNSAALIDIQVVPLDKKYIHPSGLRQLYGVHRERG